MSTPRIGVYPGTFDPITNGHMDIIRRATRVCDKLIVAVARNAGKGPLFSIGERVELVRDEIAAMANGEASRIEVRAFDSLLIEFVLSVGACFILRGLRAVSDFENEFMLAGMNSRLNPEIETVFLMSSESHQFISSKLVKEIGRLGGNVSPFVSSRVVERLANRFALDAPGEQARAKQTPTYT